MLHHERILIGVLLTCVAVAVCHSQYLGRKTIKLKNSKGFNAKIYRFHNKHALVVHPATKYSSTIVLQTRRHKIVKCCGTRSCSNINSKIKNGTRTPGGSNKNKDQNSGSGRLPGAGKDVLPPNSNPKTGNGSTIKDSGSAGSSGQDGAKQSDPVDSSGSKSEGADSSNKPAGGGDASGGASSGGDPAEGGAAPPAAAATTVAAAVGYTGRTAGEDGDYGDPDAPSSGNVAAPPGGGNTSSGSGGGAPGAGGAGGDAAGVGANSGGSTTISSGSGAAPIGGGTNATGSGGGTNAAGSGGSPTGGATGNATGGAPSGTSNTSSTGTGSNTNPSNTSTSTLGSSSTSTGNTANSPNATSNSSAPPSGSAGGSGSNTSTSGNKDASLNGTNANSTSGSGTPNTSATNSSSSTNRSASSMPASDNSTASGSNAGSLSTGASPAPGGASSAGISSTGASSAPGGASSAGSVSTVKSATIKPKPDPCVDDGCVGACDKDPAFFPGNVLTVPAAKGAFHTVCDKKYFISKEQVNHAAATKACCAMGMSLASFKTKADQTCMTDYTINTLKIDAVFYMGATDNACFKKFLWCSGAEVKIPDYKWISGQPNYLFGNQHCIAHIIDRGGFLRAADNGLNDWECYESNQYLCE